MVESVGYTLSTLKPENKMITCPNCGKVGVEVPGNVLENARIYGGTPVTTLSCCGKGVQVRAKTSWEVKPYVGESETDDWGEKLILPTEEERTELFKKHYY